MNSKGPELVRFDWAMKRMLRDKVNHGILEGLITTLLGKNIRIQKLLESESNQEDAEDKYNRVDILAEDDAGSLYLIEVQNETETAYFQRMLFGASKLVTEYINRGQGYENIRKIYSINIVYFNLGSGTDIVYHGKTEFRGIHNDEVLRLSPFQQQKFEASEVSELYPEYYILKVNDFNRWSKVPLEQWIYFLNTGDIPKDATAPGLDEAREKLQLGRMTKAELAAYYHHLDNVVVLKDNIETALNEGMAKGIKEGIAKGMEEGMAKGMEEGIAKGMEEGMAKGMEEGIAKGMEEGMAKGMEEGIAKGIAKGMAKGMEEGMAKGMEEGIAKGMEEGIAKGKTEGQAEATVKIARQLKRMGLDFDHIARATGLTSEEINEI